MEEIINTLKGKKIVIYGYGREGKSTYRFIRSNLSNEKVLIIDKNIDGMINTTDKYLKNDKNAITCTDNKLSDLCEYDIIFKTPGISFYNMDLSKIKDKITSQMELFLKYADVYKIGITGTKGKSTTSSLIYKILKDQGKEACLIGNIGVPVFDSLDDIEKIKYAVIEISAHQLQFVDVSCNMAILLNLFEEHLDHFGSYSSYINSKLNILRYQKSTDHALYNAGNKTVVENVDKLNLKSNKHPIYVEDVNKECGFDFKHKRNLMGKHNEINILFALEVSKILGLDIKKTSETIYNFKSLPHRMEFVGNYNGVDYYNDSISTIPEAAIACMNSIKNIGTIILGGLDRGIDYSCLVDYLKKSDMKNIICISTTGKKIYDVLNGKVKTNIKYFDDFEDAVKYAIEATPKLHACVLSPAAASYNMFRNFEERGDFFKHLVQKYNKNKKNDIKM